MFDFHSRRSHDSDFTPPTKPRAIVCSVVVVWDGICCVAHICPVMFKCTYSNVQNGIITLRVRVNHYGCGLKLLSNKHPSL